MSDSTAILEDAINRLFTEYVTPQLLREAETGEWPEDLWAKIEEMGLTQVFSGGSDDPWRDASAIMKACGRHAVPVPLPEHLMALHILTRAGIDPGARKLSLAQFGEKSRDAFQEFSSNQYQFSGVPWGVEVDGCVSTSPDDIIVAFYDQGMASKGRPVSAMSREERARLVIVPGSACQQIPLKGTTCLGALMRAAQIAGALERVLALTVQYAKDRVQFGKPIGAYQAIQQQLAILATASAAATRAVDAAFETAARGGDLFLDAATAKIRTGEAATIAASIAHQVHGAIGFTDEHTLHYFTRRLWTWRTEFGSESYWSKRLGTHALTEFGADGLWPAVTNAR